MDKLLNVDRKVLIFLTIICIVGIITGSIFMSSLNVNDKEMIMESLTNFINEYGNLGINKELINNLLINLIYILVIWILGISVIGLPIVIFIIFYKSFLLSFTISSFIVKFKIKGILLGVIYNTPHSIINLLVFIYLGVYSIKLSSYIIKAIIYKTNINFKGIINRYLLVLVISTIIVILTSLYETYIMPLLLKKILSML